MVHLFFRFRENFVRELCKAFLFRKVEMEMFSLELGFRPKLFLNILVMQVFENFDRIELLHSLLFCSKGFLQWFSSLK